MRIAIVGGGIAALAAARRLERLLPRGDIVLVERERRLGGKLLTERVGGFVVEGAPDSFLSRKERGIGLCTELGLGGELIARRPGMGGTFVRRGGELHPLPEGLSGMIPTHLEALSGSGLLSPAGRERVAAEIDLPPAPPGADESIAAFITRRFGDEAYRMLVEPIMTGIFGGNGDRLSLAATFPTLRELELAHGSVIRGLLAQPSPGGTEPPFLTLRPGLATLASRVVEQLHRTQLLVGRRAVALRCRGGGYLLELDGGDTLPADAAVLALPAHVTAEVVAGLDGGLAAAHAEIPHASSAVVTLAYRAEAVGHPLDGYGYVVPRSERTDVLACTWTSSKWEGRAPEGSVLVRVYAGRSGSRDVATESDASLVTLATEELDLIGIGGQPVLVRIHRWPRGMPQYVLGHQERVDRIDAALAGFPGLAVAGAAYHGVGIPDCIASGEGAAESVARTLHAVAR
ncbi:MAG: protoporphyrinogen oxidase [Acidimicrobiia bacterium]|nr:protoporphyrinogen oxidase [Acidimicrobiia bacterium]